LIVRQNVEIETIDILDISGRLVLSQQPSKAYAQSHQIDVADLVAGSYIVTINQDKRTAQHLILD